MFHGLYIMIQKSFSHLLQPNRARLDNFPVEMVAVYPKLGSVTGTMTAGTCLMSPLLVVSHWPSVRCQRKDSCCMVLLNHRACLTFCDSSCLWDYPPREEPGISIQNMLSKHILPATKSLPVAAERKQGLNLNEWASIRWRQFKSPSDSMIWAYHDHIPDSEQMGGK